MVLHPIEKIIAFSILGVQKVFVKLLSLFPYFRFFKETAKTQTPITFGIWYNQKVLGHNRYAYWPVHHSSVVAGSQNVYAGIETCPGYMPGCYISAMGKIYIGDYTQIAANVGIISSNHDLYDNRKHLINEVKIGQYCWIGMGAIILPGVELGDYTIVGAGSIVTKSFTEGFCVIAGNPAKLIKNLNREDCVFHKSEFEYNGYIPSSEFEKFRRDHLKVDKW